MIATSLQRTARFSVRWTGFLSVALFAGAGSVQAEGPAAPEIKLKWIASGTQEKLDVPNRQPLNLYEARPEAVKKLPKDLKTTLYAELKLGPKDAPTTFLVVVDEPEGKPSRLFIDANHNGDLTDDAVPSWTEGRTPGPNGKEITLHEGRVTVKIPYPDGPKEVRLFLSRYDRNADVPDAFRKFIFYSRDYALSGDVKLGDTSYRAMLVDENATGDFRGADSKSSGVRFLVDLNGDGKFDPRRESYDSRAPFNIGGITYEISDMKADGRFKIAKSSMTVEETKPAPNLARGAKAPSFIAKATSGKEVRFPEDYKGKIVLIDFWATWYPPCVREIPNIVANYEKYHDKGLEILGISFDHENSQDKVSSVAAEKKMSWLQIYEGKFWDTAIGKLYDIHSIPSMLILDGDTGEILAGTETRGPNLEQAIESALEKKKKESIKATK